MFYVSNIKVIPTNIYDLLTPRDLTFWIIDDGSLHSQGLHISTYNFSIEDIDKLLFVLKINLILKVQYIIIKIKNLVSSGALPWCGTSPPYGLELIFLRNVWIN